MPYRFAQTKLTITTIIIPSFKLTLPTVMKGPELPELPIVDSMQRLIDAIAGRSEYTIQHYRVLSLIPSPCRIGRQTVRAPRRGLLRESIRLDGGEHE